MARVPDLSPRLSDALMSAVALLPAGANVVMQLSQLPVGHAVARSRVTEGSLTRHPLKRTRTTLAFLAIAVFGTDDERAALRREIDRSHARVRSEPGDPVAYNAFDPELQGWVAACLYQGARQAVDLAGVDLAMVEDELYRIAERLGTTLQVPDDWWPRDRAAFARYWDDQMSRVRFDDVTGGYLRSFVHLDFLPRPLAATLGPLNGLLVGYFLPERLRYDLALTWSPRHQRLARTLVTAITQLWRHLPAPVRHFPLNWVLADTRRRLSSGRSVI
ncbi:MAG: DUF2236 domain-containing protein [Acidobacteriota bacterium]|nr:DUF2236 domain-containing protein [Acidobacteriota bacterium]